MRTSETELLATVLITLSFIKLAVVSVNPRAWMNFAKALYSKPIVTAAVSYLLAGIVLYMLLRSGLTIVEILAVTLFVSLLLLPRFAPFANVILSSIEEKGVKQILKDQWLSVVVWVALIGWGLCELLSRW